MKTHSPGPWEFEYDNDCIPDGDGGSYLVEFEVLLDAKRNEILRITDFELSDENARLIAAAPELLAACRRAALALAFGAEHFPAMHDDYNAVSDAIAKAIRQKP